MDIGINWYLIHTSLDLYSRLDYEFKNVPWQIPRKYLNITRNIFPDDDILDNVGSAEQSFIYLDLNNQLDKNKFVGITPCYRTEDVYDELHKPYFLKVELYQNIDVNQTSLEKMIYDAYNFFKTMLFSKQTLKIIKTSEGFDINLNDIEIGSYGIRTFKDLTWIYGTGMAEPRFTQAYVKGL